MTIPATLTIPGSLRRWSFWGGLRGIAPVLPNPRRTIVVKTPTWTDTFPTMSVGESDVLTFDLVRLLRPDETIAAIDRFDLTSIGPDGITDASPDARATGVASISDTQISQRFGNWQAGVLWIKYLVTAEVTTQIGTPIAVRGYLSVRQPQN